MVFTRPGASKPEQSGRQFVGKPLKPRESHKNVSYRLAKAAQRVTPSQQQHPSMITQPQQPAFHPTSFANQNAYYPAAPQQHVVSSVPENLLHSVPQNGLMQMPSSPAPSQHVHGATAYGIQASAFHPAQPAGFSVASGSYSNSVLRDTQNHGNVEQLQLSTLHEELKSLRAMFEGIQPKNNDLPDQIVRQVKELLLESRNQVVTGSSAVKQEFDECLTKKPRKVPQRILEARNLLCERDEQDCKINFSWCRV